MSQNPLEPSADITAESAFHLTLKLIEMRRKDTQKQFEEALVQQRWSQVAGLDGIGTGLMMAEKIVREEMLSLGIQPRTEFRLVVT